MEEEKKYTSLPSNYLSLAQLQERWLKNHQKKKDEEQPRQRKEQENGSQNETGARNDAKTVSVVTRRSFRLNQSEKVFRSIEVSKPKSEESTDKGVVVCDEEQKTDESKKKKKKKKDRRNKRKPRVGENLNGSTEQLLMDNETEKKLPVLKENDEKEGIRSEFQHNVDDQKVSADRTVEIQGKYKGLSLNGWRERNVRSTVKIQGKYEGFSLNGWRERNVKSTVEIRDNYQRNWNSGRPDRWKMWKQRDCNFVWVRKGEVSDTNGPEIPSSGSRMETREDKKKNNGRLKHRDRNYRA
ncbi:unnamed protein product [Ilex paraguariensis]|uniref:Uncharacterized protein n=1 Tax=Ilex paraguariensis TaxID=185542 RepID=A0ABC8RKK8_9AQUA